jgi:hypothetical protein
MHTWLPTDDPKYHFISNFPCYIIRTITDLSGRKEHVKVSPNCPFVLSLGLTPPTPEPKRASTFESQPVVEAPKPIEQPKKVVEQKKPVERKTKYLLIC